MGAQMSADDIVSMLLKKAADEEECEHSDMEEGYCLDCGLDRTEELASLAYDRAKDRRKYGD